jgi:DNA-binding MarR family transcriptional regulator
MSKSNTGHIGKFTSKISRRSNIYISRLISKYGINNTQLMCLIVLYRGDGKTQDFLSEELSLDKAGVTRCIKKLEELGYIVKRQDKSDKRIYNLFLTDKARLLEKETFTLLSEWEEKLTKGLDEYEKEIALKVLKQVSLNADEAYKNLK